DSANNLIDETVALGLITRVKPPGDKRVCLYLVSEEQLQKLHRIRNATSEICRITAAQAKNPNDAECGRTEENKNWCANIKTERLMKYDDLYHATKRRLDKWRHLLPTVLVFFLGAVLLASAAEATINGGGY